MRNNDSSSQNRGLGQGRNGRGSGMGGGRGLGPGGNCICPACGISISHERKTPCFEVKCPKCGQYMNRE
jgi:hypothetical protein